MPLHFAASRIGETAVLARTLTAPRPVRAANDNGRPLGRMLGESSLLRASLLHFARHGMAAADRARDEAEAAYAKGDEARFRHWLAICRLLDRRLAQGTETRLESLTGTQHG